MRSGLTKGFFAVLLEAEEDGFEKECLISFLADGGDSAIFGTECL